MFIDIVEIENSVLAFIKWKDWHFEESELTYTDSILSY